MLFEFKNPEKHVVQKHTRAGCINIGVLFFHCHVFFDFLPFHDLDPNHRARDIVRKSDSLGQKHENRSWHICEPSTFMNFKRLAISIYSTIDNTQWYQWNKLQFLDFSQPPCHGNPRTLGLQWWWWRLLCGSSAASKKKTCSVAVWRHIIGRRLQWYW